MALKKGELGWIRTEINPELIPAVAAYSEKIAEILGFPPADRKKIQLAVEEACLHIVQHSFFPDEEAVYDIRFDLRSDGIEIHLHDMGLPYDPTLIPDFKPGANLLDQDLSGLGFYLIKESIDEYRFNNLGIKGKEIVLIKYFKSELIAEGEVPGQAEIVEPPASSQAVEQINFQIRRMKDHEALEVCRCIYDCYAYSYANENVYYPERLAAMNQNGKLLSAVALSPEGEIGGHFALIFYDRLPAEAGIAVTKKKFRGQGFARQLGEQLETEARALKLRGIQVKEVTAHPYTQKFCIKLGYKDCGLLLAHSPKTLSFKGIADTLPQRNSDVLGFKYLEEPLVRKVYVPARHHDMIQLLFTNLGDPAEIHIAENVVFSHKMSELELTIHQLRSLAEVFVLKIGEDILPLLRGELKKVFREETQVIELYLPMKDPKTAWLSEELEKMGFIFTGILPETKFGDALIMQYFNGIHIDYSKIILVTDVASILLEYIRRNDPKS